MSRNPDLRGNKDDVAVSLDSWTTMATNNVATSWQINWKFHLTIKKIVRSMSKTTIPNQWLIKSLPRQEHPMDTKHIGNFAEGGTPPRAGVKETFLGQS